MYFSEARHVDTCGCVKGHGFQSLTGKSTVPYVHHVYTFQILIYDLLLYLYTVFVSRLNQIMLDADCRHPKTIPRGVSSSFAGCRKLAVNSLSSTRYFGGTQVNVLSHGCPTKKKHKTTTL